MNETRNFGKKKSNILAKTLKKKKTEHIPENYQILEKKFRNLKSTTKQKQKNIFAKN